MTIRWAWTVPLASCICATAFVHPLPKPPAIRGLLEARHNLRPDFSIIRFPGLSFAVLSGAITSSGESADSSWGSTEDDVAIASLPLPPKDDTYKRFPFNALRELRVAPGIPAGSARFDRIGMKTGGIWRSKTMGFLPMTILSASPATPWLLKEEAKGNVIQSWSESFSQLVGYKSIISLGDKASVQSTLRGLYYEALSPKAVVEMAPFIESCLAKRAQKWDQIFKSGEEVRIYEEVSSFTMEVILHAFIGDYNLEKVREKTSYLVPEVLKGLFAICRKFWWPLNRVYPFNFGPAMKARKEFNTMIGRIVEERRSALGTADKDARTGAVLDTMLEMQAKQHAAGGAKSGEMEYDDNFIYDNIFFAIFAGFETTSSTLTRLLQYLELNESKELGLRQRLLEELEGGLNDVEDCVEDSLLPSGTTGVFRAFPLLDAVVLESNRMYPAVGGVFRKMKKSKEYNGYLIPEGEAVAWSLLNGYMSESLYPEHTKFCPFRFLQRDIRVAGASPSAKDAMSPAEARKDQPRPLMFGYGKHMCTGRELAKLEIVLFLKFFLPKYEYRLVKGQDLKGSFARSAPKDGLRVVLTATGA